MAAITVPERDHKALGELVNLPGDRLGALLKALQAAEPTLLMRDLAAHVAPAAGVNASDALRLIRLLATMYAVRTREDLTVDAFADEICRAAEETGKPELQLSPEVREPFKRYLAELLSLKSLFVTAKALEVTHEHEHALCDARILTDMRPVFGLNNEPAAAVAVHMLKLSYHEGFHGDIRNFFVALTPENIREFKHLIERAEIKEASLKTIAARSGLLWLEPDEA
jgi:hypothetical protein